MQPLTKRQREVYAFVKAEILANGYCPSLAEICAGLNLRSLATVHKHIEALQQKGYLKKVRNRSRSIELVAHDRDCPYCGRSMPTTEAQT